LARALLPWTGTFASTVADQESMGQSRAAVTSSAIQSHAATTSSDLDPYPSPRTFSLDTEEKGWSEGVRPALAQPSSNRPSLSTWVALVCLIAVCVVVGMVFWNLVTRGPVKPTQSQGDVSHLKGMRFERIPGGRLLPAQGLEGRTVTITGEFEISDTK